MKPALASLMVSALLLTNFHLPSQAAEAPNTIPLWPGEAPGEKGDIGEEHDISKPGDGLVAGKPVIRLGNVSKPTITIYRPPADHNSGAAVLVCPGGAYHILAMDLEGTEVCQWLNTMGVTAALLKYRVPERKGLEKHTAALQDAQRALGTLRQKAPDLGIDPRRIGVLGFSAGGHLATTLSNTYEKRTYPRVDDTDDVHCRPDFTILIYPAYLTLEKEGNRLAPEINVTNTTPPTFIAMTEDDDVRVENALFYYLALKNAKVPAEMHLYPSGGHGYGLRPSEHLVATWPRRVGEWMRSRGLLENKR
ncbi:MAG TPA: alpha/beta hydrolase [Verrucomicrobiae bacterium]|nr:alpha/beta hydrolase [Verrucomicrobiae bacterium]